MSVLIETTLGDLIVDLFVKERPNCSKNFLKLCKLKYYNLNQFFFIEPNYIAQTGDPTNTGRGGESVFSILYGEQARYFEVEAVPKLRHLRQGLISMVNNGNNMLGSQFFITLDDNLDFLDGKHCVFGQVVEGLDTVERINEQLVDDNNSPYRDIRITHTIILHDPFDDPPRLAIPLRSPSPIEELIRLNNKIALDEKVDETEGKSLEEIKREMEEKEARSQAQILEMIGDLRHADERPPDNVLFVCKLNPATTSEDLEIIFSRFGTIACCEVIRDRRTGDSLQYAFIEFEKPEECEAAYLKMDNTLIDDRRIHVDFSQSVAKNYQWKKRNDNEDTPLGNERKPEIHTSSTTWKQQKNISEIKKRREERRDDSANLRNDQKTHSGRDEFKKLQSRHYDELNERKRHRKTRRSHRDRSRSESAESNDKDIRHKKSKKKHYHESEKRSVTKLPKRHKKNYH